MFKNYKLFVLISLVVQQVVTQDCGKSTFGTQFSFGGEYSEQGQWPWLAPLFMKAGDSFFCGSSIINDRYLLTAAHCIQRKNSAVPRSPDSVYAFLGRYDLKNANEAFAKRMNFETFHVHADWSYSAASFDGDIALLKTVTKISFNDLIKPVCLPSSSDFNVFDAHGYVAGYGKSEESSVHETRPKHVRIKSVPQAVCLFSDPVFVRVSSPRMFCAGEPSKNPCQGDSGSGWYVRSGNAYQITGIVSAALTEDCANNKYVLFTSVPEFLEWIEQYVKPESSTCRKRLSCIYEEEDNNSSKCTLPQTQLGSERNCMITFEDAPNPKVTKLNLIGSKMDYIPDFSSALSKFKNLEAFDAGWVGIKEISRRDMSPMKEFNWVSFWDNNIEEIPAHTFADLTKLDKLILAHNKLTALHPDTFANNPKLRELWLHNNQIEALPKDLFRNNQLLSEIYAQDNKIKTIKVNFLNLPNFRVISLGNNVCIDAWCEVGSYCGTGSKEAMQRKLLLDC